MDRRGFLAASAAFVLAPRALANAARPQRIALVTADEESRLVALELPSGRVRAHVPTLRFPRSIEQVGSVAVVAHSEIGALSIVDGRTLAVKHVLHGFREPRYTAAHPDGRHAFVTDAKLGEVVTIDVLAGRELGRVAVGPLARHVTLDPTGKTLWVALGSKAAEVSVVDVTRIARPRLVRRFSPPFLAHDVGFAPDGRHAWISSGATFELAVYDAATGRPLARPPGDWPPQHLTFAGDLVYVTSGWSGTLRVHRVDGHELNRTVVPVGSYNVQQADGLVVTPSLGHGDVTVLDERGRVLTTEKVARSSHDACLVAA